MWPFKKKNRFSESTYAAYSAIVAQSRQLQFYADWGVPDTVAGRFDMISLHMALAFRHLRDDEDQREFAQSIFDLFFQDMDRSLREMGIGDVGVPKKIEKMGSVFYGLVDKVDEALAAKSNDDLADTIRRNLFADSEMTDEAKRESSIKLSAYVVKQDEALEQLSAVERLTGGFFKDKAA